jgi:DNA-binding response OmpR family regulator
VVDALQFQNYRVLSAADGDAGCALACEAEYDLLLLDLALPGKPGFEILQIVRQQRPTQPIIILTAKGDESDRIRGLKLGADDYVVKPFSIKELVARIEAVLRRSPGRPNNAPQVNFPGGSADFERRELRFHDETRVELSEREAELLRYLVANRGRAISRHELLSSVWRLNPHGISTRTIDMHVARLREKLKDDSQQPSVLMTVRGKGYMFAFESNP